MTDGRLDGFEWIPGNDSGDWAPGPARPRIVAHTTEGATIEGAVAAYRKKNAWPTLTVDPRRRRKVQHVRFDRPARALANTSAPGQTNRTPTTTQVEIVATSVMRPTNGLVSVHDLTDDDLDWLGREVFGPLARATGTPLVAPLTFWPQDAGWTLASKTARQRMSPAEWVAFTGVCAHQHVPENEHWDCGGLDIARILRAAGAAPTAPNPGDLTMAQIDDLYARLGAIETTQADHGRQLDAIHRETVQSIPPSPGVKGTGRYFIGRNETRGKAIANGVAALARGVAELLERTAPAAARRLTAAADQVEAPAADEAA